MVPGDVESGAGVIAGEAVAVLVSDGEPDARAVAGDGVIMTVIDDVVVIVAVGVDDSWTEFWEFV